MAVKPDPFSPVARALFWTRAGMVVERVLRAFWFPLSLTLLGIAALAFELFALLPGSGPLLALSALGLVVAGLAAWGWWRLRLPTRAEAVLRLDRTLPGRPLAALMDEPAIGGSDPGALTLWQAHLARMAVRAAGARPVPPAPDLARRDRYALRLTALTAVVVALLFAAPQRLGDLPGLPGPAGAAVGPSWEGWIVPPAYTGRPTLYLNEIDRPAFEVPQGALVTLRLYGQVPVTQLLGGTPRSDETGQQMEFAIVHSGRLTVGGQSWELTVLQDFAPTIDFSGPLVRGRGGVLTQPFMAEDDYGVTAAEAQVALDLSAVDRRHGLALPPEPRDHLLLDLPLPMTARRTQVTDTLREDLATHPWAHLPVQIVLQATDAAGQTGRSDPRAADLPARRFFEPAAQAISELRRDILWNRDNGRRAAQLMRAMLHQSQGAFRAEMAPGMIREAVRLIETRLDAGTWDGAARDEVAEMLWDIALTLEEGELANARERLRRAQERLDQAMRDGASPDEIAELMDELREATRDYMRMLAEQAENAPQDGDRRDQGQGERMQVTGNQIQELMDEIQRLMEEGRMDEAAELMAQLNALLENLQMERGQGGEPMEGAEQMEGLGDTLGEQQRLADDTFRELQEQFNRGQQPPESGREPGKDETGEDGQQLEGGEQAGRDQGRERDQQGQQGRVPTLEELAQRQQALRDRLRAEQLGGLPGEDTAEGEAGLQSLEEADRAMDDAARALTEGDARRALERQAEAMDALREGIRQLREGAAQDRADRREPGEGQQAQGLGRDPLGRERGDAREGADRGTALPGEDPRARARDLMDEIRRRLAERERPEVERDYLDRLIERF
jgi:uncharacterized protein (TIGR02302 family)